MANIPEKSRDPMTEEALNAIEEALKGYDDDQPTPSIGEGPHNNFTADSPRDRDLLLEDGQRSDRMAEDKPPRPANDDRVAIGQMLQILRRNPARGPYIAATLGSLAWVAGGIATTILFQAKLHTLLTGPSTSLVTLIVAGAAIVVPVIAFFVLAQVARRTRDLRVVAESMAEISMRLSQPEDAGREAISTIGQAVRREVAAMGDGIERTVARAAELEAMVHNEVAALERTYNDEEVRIRGLLNEITNQRETLVAQADHVRSAIASIHLDLSHDISAVGDLIAEKVNEAAQRVTRSLVDRVIDTMTTRSEEMHTALRTSADTLMFDLAKHSDDIVSRMEQTGARITDTLTGRSTAVADSFHDSTKTLVQALDSRGEAINETLIQRLLAFEEMFQQGGTEITEKISRDATTLGNLITRHTAEFDRTVKTYGSELVERLGQRTQGISEAMRSYVDTFDQRVSDRSAELSESLDQRLEQFNEIFATRIAGINMALADGRQDIVSTLDQRLAAVSETINSRSTEVVNTITSSADELTRTFRGRADEIAGALDDRIGRFEDLMITRAQAVAEHVEGRTKTAADALHIRMEQVSQAIKLSAKETESMLGEIALSTSDTIRASASVAERTLVGTSEEVARNFIGKADEISSAITRNADQLTTLLSDRSGSVIAAIAEKSEQFSSEINSATESSVRLIEERSLAFSRAVVDKSDEIAHTISTAGENASQSVNHALTELNDASERAIANSRDCVSAAIRQTQETQTTLHADSTGLFEQLRSANVILQEVLTGAHENMNALENTLAMRVSEFVNSMNQANETTNNLMGRMGGTIVSFRDTTAQLVTDLGQLASQLDLHGRELAESLTLIEQSNERAELSVTRRHAQIDELVTSLDSRTENLEQRLGDFSTTLDELVNAASTRAREVAMMAAKTSVDGTRAISDQYDRLRAHAEEVARTMTETSAQSTRVIDEHYQRLRETADAERQRAGQAMRAVYNQAAGESRALFNDATERFAEVMRGLKQMAAEMQGELEKTRTELRRAIFELPQETAESAAQMRRVIVDQIEALAELNRIVARHGRNLDAAEPVRQPPREEPSLAVVAGRGETPAPRPNPPRGEVAKFAPNQKRQENPAPNPAPSRSGGWLTDLLSRASREENEPTTEVPRALENTHEPEERMPRHSIESLDSLSVDIARMIDHESVADLWYRYKRGERNVFTHRLYTLQGQKAFDEVRRKYQSDREFRQTVDRYISEFERLLEEVSRDDRGQVVAHTYLTSETGKVYTMLAHATGRLE